MSERLGYSDSEDFPGQWALWRANAQRQLRSAKGRQLLREVEAALVALPEKRLIADDLQRGNQVCALGAWMLKKRMDAGLSREAAMAELEQAEQQEYYTPEIAANDGAPPLAATMIADHNDCAIGMRRATPEQRYEAMLAWVRNQLGPSPDGVGFYD